MINPLQVSFPRERRTESGSARVQLFERAPCSGREAHRGSWLFPSSSAILMFYRADFPSETGNTPGIRLEGPSIRTPQPLGLVPMLETLRTFLRFSCTRTAASGLPA